MTLGMWFPPHPSVVHLSLDDQASRVTMTISIIKHPPLHTPHLLHIISNVNIMMFVNFFQWEILTFSLVIIATKEFPFVDIKKIKSTCEQSFILIYS